MNLSKIQLTELGFKRFALDIYVIRLNNNTLEYCLNDNNEYLTLWNEEESPIKLNFKSYTDLKLFINLFK